MGILIWRVAASLVAGVAYLDSASLVGSVEVRVAIAVEAVALVIEKWIVTEQVVMRTTLVTCSCNLVAIV
ncbi:hypothetical protein AAC387_Pa12g0688 [Persea americana]